MITRFDDLVLVVVITFFYFLPVSINILKKLIRWLSKRINSGLGCGLEIVYLEETPVGISWDNASSAKNECLVLNYVINCNVKA